ARLFRLEGERRSVHAIAQAGGLRPVVEHMPQMGIAIGAADFGARREEGTVLVLGHRAGLDRLIEARPAGAGIVFGFGTEQWPPAGDATIEPFILVVPIRPGKRAFGAMLAHNLILLRR